MVYFIDYVDKASKPIRGLVEKYSERIEREAAAEGDEFVYIPVTEKNLTEISRRFSLDEDVNIFPVVVVQDNNTEIFEGVRLFE